MSPIDYCGLSLPILDGDAPALADVPAGLSKGYVPRDFDAAPYGAQPYAEPLDLPLIPRDEWPERIEAAQRTKSNLLALLQRAGWKVHDQNGTNYCWINCTIQAMEMLRIQGGGEFVRLSPASVGAPMRNYQNVGFWPSATAGYIAEKGAAPASVWPVNGISRQYDNAESRAARQAHRIVEWYDVVEIGAGQSQRFERLATLLLMGIPVAIGLNWWRHAITAVELVVLPNGQFGVLIANSWGSGWGDNGFGVLTEAKGTPDDACAPRVVMPA